MASKWALGAEPTAICGIYRDAVERWLPYVEALDWETPVLHYRHVRGAQIRRVAQQTGDEELIATGLKATMARYKTMWDPKRYEKTVKIGHYWKHPQFGSFEGRLRAVARDLPNYQWLVSEYALGCMVVAVRRGLTATLAEPKLWFEWVPREIVIAATRTA